MQAVDQIVKGHKIVVDLCALQQQQQLLEADDKNGRRLIKVDMATLKKQLLPLGIFNEGQEPSLDIMICQCRTVLESVMKLKEKMDELCDEVADDGDKERMENIGQSIKELTTSIEPLSKIIIQADVRVIFCCAVSSTLSALKLLFLFHIYIIELLS